MQIQTGINANCSEATVRINLTGQDKSKTLALIKKLRHELEESYTNDDWDDDRECGFSSAEIRRNTIFGVDVLEISGDAPYNMSDEMSKLIRKFLPDAEIEWSE